MCHYVKDAVVPCAGRYNGSPSSVLVIFLSMIHVVVKSGTHLPNASKNWHGNVAPLEATIIETKHGVDLIKIKNPSDEPISLTKEISENKK